MNEDKVKAQAEARWRDNLPLSNRHIAARYLVTTETVRRWFLDVEPDAKQGKTQLYLPETIKRVLREGAA